MRKADCAKDAADESAELISVSLTHQDGFANTASSVDDHTLPLTGIIPVLHLLLLVFSAIESHPLYSRVTIS